MICLRTHGVIQRRGLLRLAIVIGIAGALLQHSLVFGNTEATWSAAVSGAWNDPSQWSTNPTVPSGATFDALLTATGGNYTVSISTPVSIDNITIDSPNATLSQSSSSLTLSGALTVSSGAYQLNVGNLAGGALDSTGGVVSLGVSGTGAVPGISGVTLAGPININGPITITNGLVLNSATLNITAGQTLFNGAQTISGTGQIIFSQNNMQALAGANSTSALTIGSGITISENSSSFAAGTIGNASAPLTNNGVITCDSSNDNLTIQGANWINNGTINLSAGTLTLGGSTTTAQVQTINRTGGKLILSGTLTNTGTTLDLATTGSLELVQGDIVGGIIESTNPSATLFTSGSPATLDGVTLDTDLDHSTPYGAYGNITVRNGLTFQNNHTLTLNSGGGIVASDASVFGGSGQIVVNNLPNGSGWTSNIGGTNVTIGPNITIRTGTGSSVDNFINITTVLNQGAIVLGGSGTPMTIGDTVPWTNAGSISVASQTLTVNGSWTNTETISATGGTLQLNGTWSNSGTISENNAVLVVGGSGTGLTNISATSGGVLFAGNYTTAQVQEISRSNAFIGVATGGEIDNSNAILNADGSAPIMLEGGTIQGGTITSTNGGTVIATNIFTTLSSLQLDAPLAGVDLTANGVTNNASISIFNNGISSYGVLNLEGPWANNGSIAASDSLVSFNSMPATPGNFSITGGYAFLNVPATTQEIQEIVSQGVSWSLNDGGVLDNTGNNLVLSQAGSVWEFTGGEIDGGTISSADGTQLVISRSSSSLFKSLIINGVTFAAGVQISGDATPTFENGLTLANNCTVQVGVSPYGSASMSFSGTQLLGGGGTILLEGYLGTGASIFASAGTLTIGANITVQTGDNPGTVGNSTMGAIINNGAISAPTAGVTLTIAGAFTNNGMVEASNEGTVTISSPSLLANLSSGNLVGGRWNVFAGSTLNLPATTITTNSAKVMLSGSGYAFHAIDSLAINSGTFTVTDGATFTSAGALTNSGTIVIGPHGTLQIVGPLTNTGLVDIGGGKLLLDEGGSPATILSQINAGYQGGAWDGAAGVTSSLAAETPGTAIGYKNAGAIYTLMYTWIGDANLDGVVNAADLAMMAKTNTGGAIWSTGDFNYDGIVNADDYALFELGAGKSGGANITTILPEPVTTWLIVLAAASLGRRRLEPRWG